MKVALLSKEHDVTSFASGDSTRQVINSVHYNTEKCCLEATNGRQYIRVPVELSEEFPVISGNGSVSKPEDVILPVEPLSKAFRSIPKTILPILGHVALTAVTGLPDKVRLTTNDLDTEQSSVVKAVEGGYPEIDSIIPQDPAAASITLSAKELKIIVQYASKHALDQNAGIKIEIINELAPIRWSIKTKEGRKVTGALMPMRMS